MKCVPLTIFYNLYSILCISKFSNLLHYLLMVQDHSKDKNAALYWYTYVSLAFFFFCTKYLYFYHFHFFFLTEYISNFFNRILTTHQKLEIYKWQEIVSVIAWKDYFRKKHTGRGWGHGIFKGIKKIQ